MRTAAEVRLTRKAMVMAPTPAEEYLWGRMCGRWEGRRALWKRRRQVIIGPYIADFAIPNRLLVIEVDGGVHDAQKSYDNRRDGFMRSCGLTVWRFPNQTAFTQPDLILDAIECHPLTQGGINQTWGKALGIATARANKFRAEDT